MSQITKLFDGSAAPDVETLTADNGGPVSPDAAFNIDLLADYFITTTGDPLTSTITISLNRSLTAIGATVGAVNANILAIPLGAVATTYFIDAKITGFEATNPASCGYNLRCVASTTGAAAAVIGVQDKYNIENLALAACDANFVAVGNTIVVRVSGAAGLTINWRAVTNHTQVV